MYTNAEVLHIMFFREVIVMSVDYVSSNIRRIRLSRGLSQTQVAESSGLSRVAYGNIEKGNSNPKVSTLQDIARALDVKLQDLITASPRLKAVRFRASKRMNSRDQVLVDISRWLEDFNALEEQLGDRLEYEFNSINVSSQSDVERPVRVAEQARELLGLSPNEAIRDIAGLLESSGIKVCPMASTAGGFFGLSVASSDGGPAIAVNVWDRISVERWIFSAAHELGHLLLHLDAYDVDAAFEEEEQEREANTFASFFLMPDRAFKLEWRETYGLPYIDRVLKVKRIFQVSYKTVLYRLATTTELGDSVWAKFYIQYKQRYGKMLGRTDEPEALLPDSFQASFPEVLRSREPDSLSSYAFIEDRLSRLVRLAIENDEISLSRGAEILRLDLEAMRDRVASWVE